LEWSGLGTVERRSGRENWAGEGLAWGDRWGRGEGEVVYLYKWFWIGARTLGGRCVLAWGAGVDKGG
jgi:hypothetical protein